MNGEHSRESGGDNVRDKSIENPFPRVVDAIADGVFVTAESGEILYANETIRTVFDDASITTGDHVSEALSEIGVDLSLAEIRDRSEVVTRANSESSTGEDEPATFVFSHEYLDQDGDQFDVISVERRENDTRANRDSDESFFRQAFEAVNDAMLAFDPVDDEIVDCNERACELLGYTREELLALGPSDIHPHELERFRSFVETVLTDGKGWTDELSCYTCQQERIPAEVSASRVTIEGRPCVLTSIRGISAQRRYESRLEALNEATRGLMIAESKKEIAEVTLDIVNSVLDWPVSAFWEYDPESDRLFPVELSHSVVKLLETEQTTHELVIESDTVEMQAFRDGKPAYYSEYGSVTDTAHPALSLQSRFLLPLGDHGLLGVGSTGNDEISESMRDLLRIVAKNAETALDRLASERKIRRRSAAIEATEDGVAILNDDAKFVYVNPAYAAQFGFESPDELYGRDWRDLLDDDDVDRVEQTILPALEAGNSWTGELSGVRRDGSTVHMGVTLDRLEADGFVNICTDISEQKAHERRLKALNDVDQALMQAESLSEISEIGIETVRECLPYRIAAVQRFDPDANALEFDAITDKAESLMASRPAYDLESTYAGTAYRRGEPVVNIPPETDSADVQPGYASLHVPLRNYGTLSILTTDRSGFDEEVVEFVQLLGTGLGSGFERVEREQTLRERRDELTRLDKINAVVREIIHSLVEAATREEIQSTVCEQLTTSDLCEYAWFGEVDAETGQVAPEAGAGVETDVIHATAGVDLADSGAGIVKDAVRSGEIQTIRQYHASDETIEADSEPPFETHESVQTVAAIPVSYGSRVYGVLIVNTKQPTAFDEETRAGFDVLGEVAGFAISAVQNRQLLLSNRVTQLEFETSDPRNLVVAISEALDCKCRFEVAEPTDDGGIRCLLRVHGVDADPSIETIAGIDGIEHVDIVDEIDGEWVLEVVRAEPVGQELARRGANIRKAIGESGRAEFVLEVPQSADIREVVDEFTSLYPDSELVAKRERKRTGGTVDGLRERLQNILTERQQTILQRSYEVGYFDWPRERTAEEVADELGISSPTLHQHLRTAERKILAELLETD